MKKKRWIIWFLLLITISCTAKTTETVVDNSKTILVTRPTVLPTPLPTLAKMEIPPLQPRPEYIAQVSPEEYSIVPQSIYNGENTDGYPDFRTADAPLEFGYQSSICIRLLLSPLVQAGDVFLDNEFIYERMGFWVDSEAMPLAPYVVQKGLPVIDPATNQLGWIDGDDHCWLANLEVGKHEVLFRFHQTSGTIQEYSWYFEISE